jgi:hypothetical protein
VRSARSAVPYHAQRVSPEESGARDPVEHERWSRSGCGMACLQMILAASGDRVPPLAELGRGAIAHGGYEARPARGFGPLIYAGFVEYAAAEFGLVSRVAAPLSLGGLGRAVAGDEVVLASVSAEIRDLADQPTRRGGHLVLVIDRSDDGERLCYHDPAGDGPQNSRSVWIEQAVFARFYAERGIAVRLPRYSPDQ